MKNFLNISDLSSQDLRIIIEEAKKESQKEKTLINQQLTLINHLAENLWL